MIDLVIQVGDFGYFTELNQLDESTVRFSRDDPSNMNPTVLSLCREAGFEKQVIHFIRGNHENHQKLKGYNQITGLEADPLGCLRFAPDGLVLERDGLKMGFLGGYDML